MKRREYTVTFRGEVPADLGERVARAHAQAILSAEKDRDLRMTDADWDRVGEVMAVVLESAWKNRTHTRQSG